MSGFLRFVVDRALAGQADQLKEYVVGVAVFGRAEEYDPRLDAIVRVEARRLRGKLDEYYAGDGRNDPVIIRMPRGSYVPVFEQQAAGTVTLSNPGPQQLIPPSTKTARPAYAGLLLMALVAVPLIVLAWRAGMGTSVGRATPIVTIGVLPFSEYSADPADELLAARLTDGVTSELARNRALGVASHTSAQQFAGARTPIDEIARALNVELVLEGSAARSGDSVRVEARLVDAKINRKIWVQDFSGTVDGLRDLERRVASGVGRAAEQARPR